jgi:ketosteroid isomerase-like protein
MRRAVVLTLLGVLATFPAHSQTANATEQEVLKAFHALDDANIKKDRPTMERMMADDYMYTHSNGFVANKAQDIAETMSADIKWTASKLDNVKVRTYGDVAVVTGLQTLTGSAKGYVSGQRRFTDLRVRRGGRWQNIGGQSTIVPTK